MEIFAAIFIVIALVATILVKYITPIRTMRLRELLLTVEGKPTKAAETELSNLPK